MNVRAGLLPPSIYSFLAVVLKKEQSPHPDILGGLWAAFSHCNLGDGVLPVKRFLKIEPNYGRFY